MSSVSVGAAITASFAFLATAWRRAWGILLTLVLLAATVEALPLFAPGLAGVPVLGALATLLVSTAATGAFYRIGLAAEHAGDPAFRVGPLGFNWGGVEWRILAANLVVGAIFFVLAVFVLFIWAIAFGVSAATQGVDAQMLQAASSSGQALQLFRRIMMGPAGIVTLIIAAPFVVGLVLLGAKLALFAITAVDLKRFAFGLAWSLTRGALAALIVTTIVIFAVQGFAGTALGLLGQGVAVISGHGDSAAIWGGVVRETINAGVNVPLISGLQIFVYRARRQDPGVAQTFA